MSRNMKSSELAPLGVPGVAKTKREKKPLKVLPPIKWFIEATRKFPGGDGWLRIVLPYPTSTNAAYKLGVIGGKHAAARASMFLSEEAKRYQRLVEDISMATGMRRPLIGEVDVLVELYREQKRGDSDSLKLMFDCLEGVLYTNDGKIHDHLVRRREDPAFPRVVVSARLAAGETLNLFGI